MATDTGKMEYAVFNTAFGKLLDSHVGNEVAITIEPWKSTTSNPQYKYYYGVVLELIFNHTGMDKESLDAILKSKFCYEWETLGGELVKRPISKTRLTTEQFSAFLEQVVRWAAEFLDLVIPDPNEAE